MPKITKRLVDELRPDPDRDLFAWDSDLRGFGIRMKPSGAASYIVQYLAIGKVGTLTPAEAREQGRRLLADIAMGAQIPRSSAARIDPRSRLSNCAHNTSKLPSVVWL
jgi:Arm DNA-binding domain